MMKPKALEVIEAKGYEYVDSYGVLSGIAGVSFLHILLRKQMSSDQIEEFDKRKELTDPSGQKKEAKIR